MSQNGQSFIIIFSINKLEASFRKKIQRELRKISARKIRGGVWSSENLSALIKIATWINLANGEAVVLKAEKIFP